MLEEVYLERRPKIDKVIQKAIKNVEEKLKEIDYSKIDKNTYNELEENYNLKLSSIAKELYLQGLKDGINLMLEAKEK